MKRNVPTTHATTMTELNVMRCLWFIGTSLCFYDRRHLVLPVENGLAGQIHAQPEYEVARGRRQPVESMACRSDVLDVNIDRAIGVKYESGTIAHAVPVDRIRHKVISRIAHCQRPERIVRRKLSCRNV